MNSKNRIGLKIKSANSKLFLGWLASISLLKESFNSAYSLFTELFPSKFSISSSKRLQIALAKP
jgi:hypothetical protein